MYRESGELELRPDSMRGSSELSRQLFSWIGVPSELDALEQDLAGDEYENSDEVAELWSRLEKLPNFESLPGWSLLSDSSGKRDSISGPRFSRGYAAWYLTPPEEPDKPGSQQKRVLVLAVFAISVAILLWLYLEWA